MFERAAKGATRAAIDVAALPRTRTPRGEVAFGRATEPASVDALIGALASLPPEDGFFYYPYAPMLAYLTARPHVTPVDIFTPGYTPAWQYRASCHDAIETARWFVVDTSWIDPAFVKDLFPSLDDARPIETRAFEKALFDGSGSIARFGRYDLRRRNVDATTSICEGIAEAPP